jgi:hypothetical protein
VTIEPSWVQNASAGVSGGLIPIPMSTLFPSGHDFWTAAYDQNTLGGAGGYSRYGSVTVTSSDGTTVIDHAFGAGYYAYGGGLDCTNETGTLWLETGAWLSTTAPTTIYIYADRVRQATYHQGNIPAPENLYGFYDNAPFTPISGDQSNADLTYSDTGYIAAYNQSIEQITTSLTGWPNLYIYTGTGVGLGSGNDDVGFASWLYFDTADGTAPWGTSRDGQVFEVHGNTATDVVILHAISPAGNSNVQFQVEVTDGTNTKTWTTAEGVLLDDTWGHVAFSMQGTNSVRLWLNGEELSLSESGTAPTGWTGTWDQYWLGDRSGGGASEGIVYGNRLAHSNATYQDELISQIGKIIAAADSVFHRGETEYASTFWLQPDTTAATTATNLIPSTAASLGPVASKPPGIFGNYIRNDTTSTTGQLVVDAGELISTSGRVNDVTAATAYVYLQSALGTRDDDNLSIGMTVERGSDGTDLTDKVTLVTWNAGNDPPTTGQWYSAAFSLSGSPSVADWQDARFIIDWDYSKSMGGDSIQLYIDGAAVELTLDLDVVARPAPADCVAATVDPTVTVGGGDETVSPAAASAVAATVAPTVVEGSVTISPAAASAVAASVDPTVSVSTPAITPAAASAVAATVDPTVVEGSITISPAAASAVAASVDPTVVQGSVTVSPAAAFALAASVLGAVVLGSSTVTPAPAAAVAVAVNPSTVLGSVGITPTPVSAIAASVAPTTVLGSITVSPAASSAVAATVDPAVLIGSPPITPAAASAVAASVSPTVVQGSVAIQPAAASSVAAVGAPVVVLGSTTAAPASASAVAASVDPTVIQGSLTLSPTVASAVAATVDPTTVLGSITTTPAAASAVAASVDPSVLEGDVVIAPAAASAVAATVAPTTVLGSVSVAPAAASAVAATVAPTTVLGSTTATPAAASAVAAAVDPSVQEGDIVVSPAAASAVAASVAPTTVLGSSTATPAAASAVAASVDPVVVLGSLSVSPAAAGAIAATVAPTVATSGVAVTPAPASAVAATVAPSILLGSTTATPAPSGAVAAAVAPSVVLGGITLAPAPAAAVAASVAPTAVAGSLSVTPAPASAVAATQVGFVDAGVVEVTPAAPASAVAATTSPRVRYSSPLREGALDAHASAIRSLRDVLQAPPLSLREVRWRCAEWAVPIAADLAFGPCYAIELGAPSSVGWSHGLVEVRQPVELVLWLPLDALRTRARRRADAHALGQQVAVVLWDRMDQRWQRQGHAVAVVEQGDAIRVSLQGLLRYDHAEKTA